MRISTVFIIIAPRINRTLIRLLSIICIEFATIANIFNMWVIEIRSVIFIYWVIIIMMFKLLLMLIQILLMIAKSSSF